MKLWCDFFTSIIYHDRFEVILKKLLVAMRQIGPGFGFLPEGFEPRPEPNVIETMANGITQAYMYKQWIQHSVQSM